MKYDTKLFYKGHNGNIVLSIAPASTVEVRRFEQELVNICPDIEYFKGGSIYLTHFSAVSRAKLSTTELPLVSFIVYSFRKVTYGV